MTKTLSTHRPSPGQKPVAIRRYITCAWHKPLGRFFRLHPVMAVHRARAGFTAIEIAMVATVIAIFALIVLPLFRNRVDEAKVAAAKADIASLMKAEQLVKADTGFYLRLEDLDNIGTAAPAPIPANGITIETPILIYQDPEGDCDQVNNRSPRGLTQAERNVLAGSRGNLRFKGAYATMNRVGTYADLTLSHGLLFRGISGQYAAIRDIPNGSAQMGEAGLYDSPANRYPVDPWGSPYLFFPPTCETEYSYASIFSMGPDGMPGDNTSRGGNQVPTTRADYTRERVFTDPTDDWLGTGDDIEVRF